MTTRLGILRVPPEDALESDAGFLLCKKYRVSVIINSDSHFCTQIGNVDLALSMLREIDFPEDLIINADKDRFKEYINNNTTFFNN